jgi:hypothetical protein
MQRAAFRRPDIGPAARPIFLEALHRDFRPDPIPGTVRAAG